MVKDLGASDGPGCEPTASAADGVFAESHPSRNDPTKAYLVGTLDERKAISRFLTVRAARALYRASSLPWWQFWQRRRTTWSAVGLTIAAREIESGEHVEDNAVWVVDIKEGVICAREAFLRDSDRSPKGGDEGSVHDSATIAPTHPQTPRRAGE